VAIGVASSLVYSHAPLVSFATLAGGTLHLRQAIVSTGLIWLAGQVYGFAVRHYPLEAIALLWGGVMGLGAVAATLIASLQPQFSRCRWLGHAAWLGVALVLGFITYQSSSLLVNQWVGMHGLTSDRLLRIFFREAAWAIGLFAGYTFLVLAQQYRLRRSTR